MVADLAWPRGSSSAVARSVRAAELREVLGERVAIANPLDYQTYIWGDRGRLRRCFAAMLAAGFDATLLVLDYPRPAASDVGAWDMALDAFIARRATASATRAIVVASLPETLPAAARERLLAAGHRADAGPAGVPGRARGRRLARRRHGSGSRARRRRCRLLRPKARCPRRPS